jgi:hypothetical protein
MRDGLVMFESAEDADRFASKLEEEGHSQVSHHSPVHSAPMLDWQLCHSQEVWPRDLQQARLCAVHAAMLCLRCLLHCR